MIPKTMMRIFEGCELEVIATIMIVNGVNAAVDIVEIMKVEQCAC